MSLNKQIIPSYPKHQTQQKEQLLIIFTKIHFHQRLISYQRFYNCNENMDLFIDPSATDLHCCRQPESSGTAASCKTDGVPPSQLKLQGAT